MCLEINQESIANYILHKQYLLYKQSRNSIESLIVNQLGLHSTDYLTPYISLWTRIKDFNPSDLFDMLNSSKILRKRVFRGTVFLIHQNNLPLVKNLSQTFSNTWIKGLKKELKKSNFNLKMFEKDVLALLKRKNDMTTRQISSSLENSYNRQLINLTIRYLELKGILVRTSQRYPTDRVIRYGLMQVNYPEKNDQIYTEEEAFSEIFIRYLYQFGPASIDDFSWWLPATKTKTKDLIEQIGERIVEIVFNNKNCYMLKEDYGKLKKFDLKLPDNHIFFLPYEDHFPKAYINRGWFLSPKLNSIVMGQKKTTLGQLMPTIWLNNQIAGKWSIKYTNKNKTEAKIVIEYIDKLNSSNQKAQKKMNQEKSNLENFFNDLLKFNEKMKKG